MDTIRACPECQEQHTSGALSHRERVLQHFSTAAGLGPIDLVLCSKETKGGFGEQKTASFFHQVVGYDVCNTASLAAYFSELCSNVEEVGFFSGLFTAVQWHITQCVYCAYDAFSRLDVRCHMAIPGGVIAYAVDCKGQRYEMTAAHWKQVSISAFLRYEYYNPSIFRGLPAVVQQQAMRTPDAEETILDSILDLYYDHVPQQVIEMLRPGGQRGGANPEDNDPLLAAVLHHFKRRRVMEGAVEFFTQIASLHAPAVLHLCAALSSLGRNDDALQVLRGNALRLPHDTNVICALAAAEAAAGNSQDALALARHALMLAPKSTTTLLCMARVQATCGAPALAVLAMHLIVPPSDQQVLFKRIFPFGLPPFARITTPACMPWTADHEVMAVVEEEACLPRTSHAIADWQSFVQQLCGIQDGEPVEDRKELLAPDLFSDLSILKTSLVYLLPHITAAKYSIACSCVRAMGVENFAMTLQALARNATNTGALGRGRRRASKRGSLSGRSQPPSVTLDPVPEQVPGVDASQELSADLTQGSMDAPMQHAANASATSSSTPMSGVATGNGDMHTPFPGHVQPGEVSHGYATSVTDDATAELHADLSHVPKDLTAKDHGKRHQGSPDGHPVGEGTEICSHIGIAALSLACRDTRYCSNRAASETPAMLPILTAHGASQQRGSLCAPANAMCEGVKRSGSSNQHLLRADESSIVLKGDSAVSVNGEDSQAAITHMSWEDPSKPPVAHSLRKDAPRFASAGTAPVAHPVTNQGAHSEGVDGSESPVGVLREALQKYEAGSADVTVEGLARLQLRAQEYVTRAGPTTGGRIKRRRRLQTALATQGCKAADNGRGTAGPPVKGADSGPVAASIVDQERLSATAHQLQQESSLKKSLRQCEAQRIMAALLESTSAPPGAVHHLSRHSVDVISMLFADLDAVALVHVAASETPRNGVTYSYSTAAEVVKKHEFQFLTFRHRTLHTAISSRALLDKASVGDWLAWGASCERVRCLKHAEYAYARALNLVHPHRCLTGHMSLARLRSADADIHTVFDHLTEVLLHLDYRRNQQEVPGNSDPASVVKEGDVPASVLHMLVVLTSLWGMSAVQSRLEKGAGQYHPSIEAVVEQAFEWGTDGCDM